MLARVVIRPVEGVDGEQLRELGYRSMDGGRVPFRPRHHVSVAEAATARRPESTGFVAVAPDGVLVGSAWVTCSRVSNADGTVRLAWLHSLNVDPQWRRQGIAKRLTDARLAHVDTTLDPTIVGAAIQAGNEASMGNARRWANRELGTVRVTPVPPPRRAPRLRAGLLVRPAATESLAEVVEAMRTTIQTLILAPAPDADELAAWLNVDVAGQPVHEYLIATDASGRVVAGLGLEDEGRVQSMEVGRLPVTLQLANLMLRVVPKDGLMRNVNARLPFFLPGHEADARHLWQTARWQYRQRATSIVTAIDPAGPFSVVLRSPPWLPSTKLRIVTRQPAGVPLAERPLGVWV